MENTDGSEGNATKISDSAYSNSCGNSQSQRSNSFKSRHSGSNSSGSSGYGGKTSSSLSNSNEADPQSTPKRGKEKKKKSKCLSATSTIPEAPAGPGAARGQPANEDLAPNLCEPQPSQDIVDESDLKETSLPEPVSQEKMIVLGENDVPMDPAITTPSLLAADNAHSPLASDEKDEMDIVCPSPSKIFQNVPFSVNTKPSFDMSSEHTNHITAGMEGFSCVVSMCDGVVLYTNSTLTDSLDYPKGMWIGRSFIDFIHPKDRSLFVSKTSGTESSAIKSKDVSGTTLFCRIRKYKGLKSYSGGTSYGIRDREVIYVPYELTLTFRDVNSIENNEIYLLITATPVMSPFQDGKIKTTRFSSRHTSTGIISHIEPVAPLGYLPQDIIGHCILDFYHPEDMPYLKEVYETITKSEKLFKSKPYRFCTQNGDYLTIESEWSSFINPWSRKIEFITSNNNIVEGPTNTDVFDCNKYQDYRNVTEESCKMAKVIREEILQILSQVVVLKSDSSKQIISKRCKDLATFMEHLMNECERAKDELHLEVPDETNLSERDSVMLGEISPHHDYNDSKSSTDTPLSYNQLNYNENLQRFFESRPWTTEQDVAEEPKINISTVEPLYENTHGQCYSTQQESAESGASGCSEFLDKFCHFRPLFHSRHASVTPKGTSCHDYKPAYLTEKLLNKHNSVMEKLLFKKHREARSVSKAMERDKCERRDKKKDFQAKSSTIVISNYQMDTQEEVKNGVKRPSSLSWEPESESHKVSKLTSPKLHLQESPVITLSNSTLPHSNNGLLSAACVRGSTTSSTVRRPAIESVIEGHPGVVNLWPPFSVTMTPIQSTSQSVAESIPSGSIAYPGMYPAVYLISSQQSQIPQENSTTRSTPYPFQYMMYPPTIFTSQAFMYPPMAMAYQPMALSTNPLMPHVPVAPLVTSNIKPLDLPYDNYHQACQVSVSLAATPGTSSAIQGGFIHPEGFPKAKFSSGHPRMEFNDAPPDVNAESSVNSTPSNNLNRVMAPSNVKPFKINESASENLDVEASSYSSFYSSFLKTNENSNSTADIDSAGEPNVGCSTFKDKECADNISYTTNEVKNKRVLLWRQTQNPAASNDDFKKTSPKIRSPKETSNKRVKRDWPVNTVQPPWLDSVCVTSELVYRYQIAEKNIEDVLKSDMDSLSYINQSSLVSEQLSQLYMEFKLEGLSEKLTLEEGITSNSSSEEEHSQKKKKRREYAKLVMIYEEDAPMPPPFTQ